MANRIGGVHAENSQRKAANHRGEAGKKDRQALQSRFEELLKNAKDIDLKCKDVRNILMKHVDDKSTTKRTETSSDKKGSRKLLVVLCTTVLVPVLIGIFATILEVDLITSAVSLVRETPCLIDNNAVMMEMTRPIVNCKLCQNLYNVPVERNISKSDFIDKYAYSGIPVLIKGATASWSAMTEFSFQFLKDLYKSRPEILENVDEECQFFPYKTEFTSLSEVFDMDEDRASLKPGQPNWYIGWSNCLPDTGAELRKHYSKPYFLPEDSESSSIDWLFMGGTGEGANLHIDYVQRPSWQAQISGKKSWALVPTPECEALCHSMNVTVEKGDIIVVDTNNWYHSTFVHPGEISITIGSEYD